MVSYRSVRQTAALKVNLRDAARKYVELAQLQYRGGSINYIDVLDAQRRYFDAQIGVSNAVRDEHLALVDLYKALGGGWRNNPAGFFGLSVCPDPSSDPGFLFPGRRFVASFPKTLFAMPLRNAFPRESSSRRAVIRSPGSGIGIVPACRCPLCGSDQSRTLFFPHLGRMSRNISKFIPAWGVPARKHTLRRRGF